MIKSKNKIIFEMWFEYYIDLFFWNLNKKFCEKYDLFIVFFELREIFIKLIIWYLIKIE